MKKLLLLLILTVISCSSPTKDREARRKDVTIVSIDTTYHIHRFKQSDIKISKLVYNTLKVSNPSDVYESYKYCLIFDDKPNKRVYVDKGYFERNYKQKVKTSSEIYINGYWY